MAKEVSDREMEHYLMFPEAYCRGCEGGAGPLCITCLNALSDDETYYGDDNDYGQDDPPSQLERNAADEAFDNEVLQRGY